MTSPVVTFVINPRSRRRYDQLVSAMEHVWIVLEEAEKNALRLEGQERTSGRGPTPDHLVMQVRRAMAALENMNSQVVRSKAELLAADWRY